MEPQGVVVLYSPSLCLQNLDLGDLKRSSKEILLDNVQKEDKFEPINQSVDEAFMDDVWIKAMQEKLDQFQKNYVLKLVSLEALMKPL
ncbi:hypothetical protein CR513_23143, partial [Mucuna pruriens]